VEADENICARCAETVKTAARVCRYRTFAGRAIAAAAVIGFACAASPGPAPPPQAPSDGTVIARINGWAIRDDKGSCSTYTSYERDIFVRVDYDFGHDTADLWVFDPAWESVRADADYKVNLRFSNGGEFQDAPATGVRIDSATGRMTGVWIHLDGSDFMEDFALAGGVTLSIGETRLGALSLAGTKEVAVRLQRCAVASYKAHPPDPFAEIAAPAATPGLPAEPARAKVNLASLISNEDYPASALRAEEQGVTGFRLEVGANGRVTACTITSSSGSAALDAATCRLLTARARFTPARDSSGAPTTDTVSARYVWRIQE
jgi:TonB family protein